jgi:hypothetical protein
MEQVSIGSRDGQTPRDHHSTSNLLNRLDFPAPTRSTVMEVAGNGVPGAVGQGRIALFPGLEVPWVNGARQIRQGFGSGSQGELQGSGGGCLSAVGRSLEHWIEPLWVSVL